MKEWLQLKVAEVLRDAEDDWITIDNVIAYGWEEGTRANEDPREATVQLLRFLLDQDLMLIGDLGDSGFEGWTCSVEEAVKAFVEARVVRPTAGNRWAHFGGSKSQAAAAIGSLGAID